MNNLMKTAKHVFHQYNALPFSIYSAIKEQHILNAPIIKPMLICVLDGCKSIGEEREVNCAAGSFLFLSNKPDVEIRNIPLDIEYLSLIIEFDFEDFDCFKNRGTQSETFFTGEVDLALQKTLQQFVEWSAFAPAELWPVRRQEILQLLYYSGYQQVASVMEPPSLSHRLYSLVKADITANLGMDTLAAELAMSESTLRRKLSAEGTSLQQIKDSARLGYGLHLVQTSADPVGLIAEQCGYLSQSRFTDKFKQLFGITPTELRKTRLTDSGE